MRTQGPRPRPRTQKNPRPRTALPRIDPLEAKNRNDRSQGPRTQRRSDLIKKRSSLRNFVNCLETSSVLQEETCLQNFFRKFSGVLQDKTKLVMTLIYFQLQKLVLSSSRGQGIFEDLQASRPRTLDCVFEDSTSGLELLSNEVGL